MLICGGGLVRWGRGAFCLAGTAPGAQALTGCSQRAALMASPPLQEAPAVTPVQELQQGHQHAWQSLGHQHHRRRGHQVREGQHAVTAGGAAEATQGRGGRHRPQAGQDPREGVARALLPEAGTNLFL